MTELIEAANELALALSENLAKPSRRAVIDPLVAKMQKALRIRWGAQRRQLESKGLPHLKAALDHVQTLDHGIRAPLSDKHLALSKIPIHHKAFGVKFRKAAKLAYAAGVAQVSTQLPASLQEAPRKKPASTLPGSSRDPVDVEDELDHTTTDRVSDAIDTAFSTQMSYAELVAGIATQFKDWSTAEDGETSRAETVGLDEVSTAYHDGGADYVDDWRGGNGPVEKHWVAEDDACPECEENAAEDFIDSEAPHSSGDDEPPAHPNCRCEEEYRPTPDE